MEKSINDFYIADLGTQCNSACLMCVVGADRLGTSVNRELVIENIKEQRNQGKNRVEFTGGEPLVRPDIVELIRAARDFGYTDISISTNGRMLGDKKFCKLLIDSGLNKTTISIHGSLSKIHDAITRINGSFDETVSGFNNFKSYSGNIPMIATVVTKLNYGDLINLSELLTKLGVKTWSLSDLTPDGRGRDSYEKLSVKRSELRKILSKIVMKPNGIEYFNFFNFSRCLLPDINYKMIYFDIGAKMAQWNLPETGNWRCEKDAAGFFHDVLKRRVRFCDKCNYSASCGGAWKVYLDVYGENPEDF